MLPVHQRRTHIQTLVGHERPGQPGNAGGKDETDQFVTKRWKTERKHPAFIVTDPLNRHTEAGMNQAVSRKKNQEQDAQNQIVKAAMTADVQKTRQGASHGKGHAVAAAIALQADETVIQHLRKGQSDHDKRYAADAKADRANDQRNQHGDQHCQGPG